MRADNQIQMSDLGEAMKTKTQHTPGPWTITEENRVGAIRILGGDERECIDAISGKSTREQATVCRLGGPEKEANARLIAAAPELLDMLRRMVRAIDRMEASPVDGLADDARELIRKAEGE